MFVVAEKGGCSMHMLLSGCLLSFLGWRRFCLSSCCQLANESRWFWDGGLWVIEWFVGLPQWSRYDVQHLEKLVEFVMSVVLVCGGEWRGIRCGIYECGCCRLEPCVRLLCLLLFFLL